ncbi:predicted protein [Nematostella vectensis]|uniref:Neuronal stem cell leukemia 2-like protein n=1 Tax=Nematostella vectensis TaxID=45351 RepID=A7SM99_NEMVE|nr:neuronal stem cell leukemia 2-like protein [Nematostella vectensis]EDO35199.1 predicted protein [Nematostella vectensis]|eukprot:XP_001627299.1 predicted protein [Nematostella vectensis]
MKYDFIWTANGNIYLRKNERSPSIHVTDESVLINLRSSSFVHEVEGATAMTDTNISSKSDSAAKSILLIVLSQVLLIYRNRLNFQLGERGMMEDDTSPLGVDPSLLCTEDRGFLYNNDVPIGATGFESSAPQEPQLLNDLQTEMAVCSEASTSYANAQDENIGIREHSPKRVRKRNAQRDRLRSEAEQNAYKKLREIVPALKEQKKVTKLDTIQQTCEYIEYLNMLKTKKEQAKMQNPPT